MGVDLMAIIPLMRKMKVIRCFEREGALTKDTALTFAEAGIRNPSAFSQITSMLMSDGILRSIDDKYYLDANRI